MTGPADRQQDHLDPDQLQTIIDASTDCIKVLDLDAHLLSMNAGGMATMEIGDFDICRHVFWPTVWEGDARLRVEAALEAARMGHTSTFEGPARTFAGTPRWWEVRVSPIRGEDGTITQLLAISRDVTARKTAERQLQASEHRLRERADHLGLQVTENERALAAFVRFTTEVASSTDLEVLTCAALQGVQDVVSGTISGFYLIRGETAYPLMFSSNTPPEVRALRQHGFPLQAPLVAEALRQQQVAFAEHDRGRQQSVGYAGALSITPYFREGQPYALFASGIDRPSWTAQEKAIIESVGRGLGLALERSDQTQQLQERSAGLDAFVAFSERVASTIDAQVIAHHAVEALRATLGEVSVAYYTQEGELWKAQVWSEDFAPEVAAVLAAGIPMMAPSYAEAVLTRRPVFVPGWQAESEQVAKTDDFGAGAFYPCFVKEEPLGLLAMGTQRAGDWTPREQAVFNAVGRSLTLALERTEQTRELTAQRDLLEARTTALQASNEELEAFSYSVSHDLRTPLRHIISFGGLLRRALPQPLDEKAARYFMVIEDAAQHLSQLIDGMLELSRTSRQPFQLQDVDLGRVVDAVRGELTLKHPGRQLSWQVAPLPTVAGDVVMLRRVIISLLDNAVKYTRTREKALIEVWAEDRGQTWAVFVRDNGVGFDQRYQDKLFTMFQRLHHQTDFEGAGMSLANARRIITRHGGVMTAEGQVDRGATFGFILPKTKS